MLCPTTSAARAASGRAATSSSSPLAAAARPSARASLARARRPADAPAAGSADLLAAGAAYVRYWARGRRGSGRECACPPAFDTQKEEGGGFASLSRARAPFPFPNDPPFNPTPTGMSCSAAATDVNADILELTEANVEKVLDEVRRNGGATARERESERTSPAPAARALAPCASLLQPPNQPTTNPQPTHTTPQHPNNNTQTPKTPPNKQTKTKTKQQVRPYLMADGGNVELVEVDGLVVKLKLKGACGSCPSSLTTMTMGIKRRLMEKIPVRSKT